MIITIQNSNASAPGLLVGLVHPLRAKILSGSVKPVEKIQRKFCDRISSEGQHSQEFSPELKQGIRDRVKNIWDGEYDVDFNGLKF